MRKLDDMTNAKVDVTQGRSYAFEVAVMRLQGFIDELDINADARNKLIDLTCKQVGVAERDAFMLGFDMALKLMRDLHDEEE